MTRIFVAIKIPSVALTSVRSVARLPINAVTLAEAGDGGSATARRPRAVGGVPRTDRGHQATTPTEIPKPGWKDIGKRTLAEVKADRVPMMAAAVAFAAFLALFPAMIAAISVYGLVVDPDTAARHAGDLAATLPAEAASIIGSQLERLADSEPAALGTALVISVMAALWSASGGIGMLINALNVAYDEEEGRGFVKTKGLAILLTLGAILFLGLTVGLIVALAVLYRFGPDREDARWAWISPGAMVAGVLWLVGSLAFSFFVTNFGSYNETYGTVAGVIVLMLWLQISALIVLLGAEMNGEMERQTLHDTTTGTAQAIGSRGAEPADDTPPSPGEDATEAAREAVRI